MPSGTRLRIARSFSCPLNRRSGRAVSEFRESEALKRRSMRIGAPNGLWVEPRRYLDP